MSNLFDELGLDPENFEWWELALCRGMDTQLFFELYENDSLLARNVDKVCEVCPVRQACGNYGTKYKKDGVWGGIYLVNGKPDRGRNKHKEVR